MIEETLASLVDRFNRHAAQNPAVGAELNGIRRTIRICLTDERNYAVDLDAGRSKFLFLGRNLRRNGAASASARLGSDLDAGRKKVNS